MSAPSSPPEPTLADQATACRREAAMRAIVYPRLVANGRMTQKKADRELAAMSAAAETLARLAIGDA